VRERFDQGAAQGADGLAACAAIALDSGDIERALALSRESLGAAPIAVASWNRSAQMQAALVHFRALHALGRDAEAAPWIASLREPHRRARRRACPLASGRPSFPRSM